MRGGIEIDVAQLVFAVDFQPIRQGGEAEIEAVGFDHDDGDGHSHGGHGDVEPIGNYQSGRS